MAFNSHLCFAAREITKHSFANNNQLKIKKMNLDDNWGAHADNRWADESKNRHSGSQLRFYWNSKSCKAFVLLSERPIDRTFRIFLLVWKLADYDYWTWTGHRSELKCTNWYENEFIQLIFKYCEIVSNALHVNEMNDDWSKLIRA